MAAKPITDWLAIERECIAGMNFHTASERFNIKIGTIQKYAQRHKWATPLAVAKRVEELSGAVPHAIEAAANDWIARGENYRKLAFDRVAESVKKFIPRAPKSFRELEAADKIAGRRAGIDSQETSVGVLIQMNERMESFEDESPIEKVIEATLLPVDPTTDDSKESIEPK